MGILINFLVIILAIISFFIFYLLTVKKDQSKYKKKAPLNYTDYEFAENLSPEKKVGIEKDENKNTFKEEELKRREEFVNKIELKEKYDITMIRLLVRDPNNLYAYWEVNKEDYYHNKPCLRLFSENEEKYYDIQINHQSDNWYISPVKANHNYKLAIGYKKDNIFFPLAYSNSITTPAEGPSEIIDEEWMTIEELKKYTYKINYNTLSLIKSLEKRKREREINADSLSILHKK
jgi:hypothetical protein